MRSIIRLHRCGLTLLTWSAVASTACAQTVSPDPADLKALAALLDKPAVRGWLKAQADGSASPAADAGSDVSISASQWLGQGFDAARTHLHTLVAAVPDLPAQLGVVRATLAAEIAAHGVIALLGPVLAFVLLGVVAERMFWHATAGLRERVIGLPMDTVEQRLAAIGWRTLYGVGVLGAFAVGSVGAFLALDWPPMLQAIVLTYLLVFLALRLTLVLGRIVLAPGAARFRMLPIATETARYWFVRSAVLVTVFTFAKGTFRLVPVLGASLTARTLVGIALSLVVLLIALITLWRRPAPNGGRPVRRSHEPTTWFISFALVGIWLTAFTGKTAPFDVGLVLLILALSGLGLRRAVDHLMRPAGEERKDLEPDARPVAVVAFERGVRIVLVVGATLVIARTLDLDLITLMATDTRSVRLARGLLDFVVIALAADFVWGVTRAWIDRSLNAAGGAGAAGSEAEHRHRQRLRTLLPILRNLVLIIILAAACLTTLASLGIEVGPLIAGAGVVGIAIGFGAQTLVKDVISGLFFLFDDAFRVGEYIESGRLKGTVEAFSLRSVKLRHHRGLLHTVPFGALSAITNYSRDWVADKIAIGLDYDTDLDQVRRVVKAVGRELQDDPEFAPDILEPLKMQGVSAFGDFALQVQLKMLLRPGEQQYTIRHRAHALIKQAFDREGIRFAYPTVAIAGGNSAQAAAAQAGLMRRASEPIEGMKD